LEDAIDALEEVKDSGDQSAIDEAYKALIAARKAFNEAKKRGTSPDKTALEDAMATANHERNSVQKAASNEEVPSGQPWATEDQLEAIDSAIAAATAVKNKANATKVEVDKAEADLLNATKTFKAAVASNGPGTFVAVTDIIGVPIVVKMGTPLTLTSTVEPDNATNTTIVWSVVSAGTTGANIAGGTNILNTTKDGSVMVRATITNGRAAGRDFTKDFPITISASDPEPGSVSIDITIDLTDKAPIVLGTVISLSGANGASKTTTLNAVGNYSSIVWSINGTGVIVRGPSIILDSTNTAYNTVGEYLITVEVIKDGVPYSTTVIFTVEE
jgi:hypothetical protein